MDYYPQDLLVGVFPLVFAVNAIFFAPSNDADDADDLAAATEHRHRHHGLFERFLDVLVSSLMDDGDGRTSSNSGASVAGGTVPVAAERGSSLSDHSSNNKGLSSLPGKIRLSNSNSSKEGASSSSSALLSDDDLLGLLAANGVEGDGTSGNSSMSGSAASASSSSSRQGSGVGGGSSSSAFYAAGFGRRSSASGGHHHHHQDGGASSSSAAVVRSNDASYARLAGHHPGQGFFQRARIEAVGARHGFPPPPSSRTGNRAAGSAEYYDDVNDDEEVDVDEELEGGGCGSDRDDDGGILSLGWLERHANALPSAVLIVCQVRSSREIQHRQDQVLVETVEHFQNGLRSSRKRRRSSVPPGASSCQVQIHVIALLDDDVSLETGEIWGRAIRSYVEDDDEPAPRDLLSMTATARASAAMNAGASSSVKISLLRPYLDLQVDTGRPVRSLAFQSLHDSIRDASLRYYQGQAGRVKAKLANLLLLSSPLSSSADEAVLPVSSSSSRPASPTGTAGRGAAGSSTIAGGGSRRRRLLLPRIVRYCFKIATFYEFQLQPERSVQYLSEAWRHAALYKSHLLGVLAPPAPSSSTAAAIVHESMSSSHGGDLEVSLSNSSPLSNRHGGTDRAVDNGNPLDCLYQAYAVAEWLHLKLLQAGLSSHAEAGWRAAQDQCRRHTATFGSSSTDCCVPAWFQWQYVARQRLVLAQLVERHPPPPVQPSQQQQQRRFLEEIGLRFSPWRCYRSVAEARLQLAHALELPAFSSSLPSHPVLVGGENLVDQRDPLRRPYVRGIDGNNSHPSIRDALAAEFRQAQAVNYREAALNYVLRAISMYEREMEKEKKGFYAEDEFRERCSSRSGARLYYLAGGILLGMKRHEEAVPHLEAAARFCTGWRELELAIRRMLIECYEKKLPSSASGSSEESNQTIVSMLLDSYFNANMSSGDLRRALGQFASIRGAGKLAWHHEAQDEEDTSLPVSFAVSFPGRTHATAGDTVQASVLITSNLDYAVHVNSVILLSLAGKLPIPTMDLSSAANASEGIDGGIIIQSRTSVMITTYLELPKDTSNIAIDDSGNGGEIQGVAGKGSFAKSARPRTAGITSAGGARLVSEEDLSVGSRASQGWNTMYLGGKPLRCDGMCMEFYPVQVEKATGSAEAVTPIILTVEKKKPKTAANIKRTPFEEENYIASAWSRPESLKLSLGPRSLRVLPPMPDLTVTDVTEELTGGNALEGTVNRVLLKLTAGEKERCRDIKYKVTCFSVLISPNGATRRLVSEAALVESEGAVSMKNPSFRTPSLVAPSEGSSEAVATEHGYSLPRGWRLAGTGHAFSGAPIASLSNGESGFVTLDFYRPSPLIHTTPASSGEDSEVGETSLCKTDFYVSLSYRQEGTPRQTGKRSSIRRSVTRPRPVMRSSSVEQSMVDHSDQSTSTKTAVPDVCYEEVSLEFTGSIVWAKPLSASFRRGAKKSYPSGIVGEALNQITNTTSPSANVDGFFVVDGDDVSTDCVLKADCNVEGLKTEVLAVRFENTDDASVSLSLRSVGPDSKESGLYSPALDDPCRLLSRGSRIAVPYIVKPRLNNSDESSAGVTTSLGTIAVDWKPSPLPLPSDAKHCIDKLNGIASHGPLRLELPGTLRFAGPNCVIRSPPFGVAVKSVPSAPRAGSPFDLAFSVTNRTPFHQALSVTLKDPAEDSLGVLLFSGTTRGELVLSPHETQVLAYTMVATRAGRMRLPSLNVVSLPTGSTLLSEEGAMIYVFP